MPRAKKPKSGRSARKQYAREVDWKLLFNQLFALEIKKEHVLPHPERGGAEALDRLLRAYTCYTPASFNDALDHVGAAQSSEEAYEARVAFYENPQNRRLISDLDLRRCLGEGVRGLESVRAFLDVIWRNKDRPIPEGESFFESAEGQSAIGAFAADGEANDREVALVFVPGFAGHTIKYYLFEEIVLDANAFHGRPPERPLLKEDGIDLEFETHADFYARGAGGEGTFDILQPAGRELGNTTGANAETTDLLYEWICSLPARYARKKLILLGYSKGAPIVFDLVRRHPDLSSRVLGYVSFAGVVQGTQVARLAVEQAGSILRDVPIADFIARLRAEDPSRVGRLLSPVLADLDLSWLSVPRIRAVFEALGYDLGPLERQIDRVLGGREVREMVDGARDLSPLERARWNLKHLDNETFRDPAFVLSLSAVTDVQDFVRPTGLESGGLPERSLLAPVLTSTGTLDWKHLSLDALFLYVTSIDGFKNAPGGLYDTQVELGNTKLPVHDRRPLSESLTSEDLEALFTDEELRALWKRCRIRSADALALVPRRALFPPSRRDHIDAIDLGEFKGHHWTPFVQALRPPPELSRDYARWSFPRKAFMRAVIQLLGLYNLVQHVGPAKRKRTRPPACAAPAASGEDDCRDVVFFHSDAVDGSRRQLVNLYNLMARAASYGIVVNSARAGLGTSSPTGRPLKTESLYYQALRLYSAADAEFQRGLLKDPAVWPLPRSLAIIVGRFPCELASSYPEEPIERLAEIHRALKVLAPGLKPFELRKLAPGDYVMRGGRASVSFATAIRESLWRGTRARLREIEPDATGASAGVQAKLRAMLAAFTPLCTVFSAAFDQSNPGRSATRLTTYLPAFHTLHAEDLDDPSSWYLERGLKNFELPRPVQLAAAVLTHVRYLQDADSSKAHAIKLEVHRDYQEHDRVTTVASFGRLFEGSADELYAFDASDVRDALHIVFRPRFAPDASEAPADRRFKETFNRVFSPFEVEAHIHQITLNAHRKPARGQAPTEDDLLRPGFALTESKISFRVHRHVDTVVEHLPLQAAGFSCRETVRGPHRFHCWRDFGTWERLRDEFFYGRSQGSGRVSFPTHLRGRLLEQLVGTATRAVVDRSIESIEDAIDEEVGRTADDALRRYSKAREVIFNRLHDKLF